MSTTVNTIKKGIVAEYDSPAALLHAAKELKKAGYTHYETYSPFPIHGMDGAMGLKESKIGWIAVVGGAIGAIGGMSLQGWASAIEYPLTISGKKFFSFQAFIPVTFELMILFTAFFTVFGMIAINKLPMLYHSIFNHSTFAIASSHGFFISIEGNDQQFNEKETVALLEKIGGTNIEYVEE